jgi:streptogramin lyase
MGVLPPGGRRASYARVRLFSAVAAAVLIAGCSGGGGGSQSPIPTNPGSPAKSTATTAVSFRMNWGSATQSATRSPKYVPVTARSVSVAVNGGVPQYLNSPATTITFDAAIGVDTFAFQTYDAQNGQGNVLSRASITQTITIGVANVVGATLNGVIASLAVSLGNPAPNAGVPATTPINVAGRDADNNAIVGPGDYNTAIKLTINDPANTGTLSISTNTIATPGTATTLTYNGGTLASASIAAGATGIATASTTFAPTPTFYQFSIPTGTNKPQWIAAGSDGNMWFTESPGNKVARITPAGVVTEFTIPTANSNPQGIISASDGKLWFTESAGSKIGAITTAGAITEFSTLFANDGPQLLVDRLDGNVWYVGLSGNHIGFQGITSGVAGETTVPTASSQPYGVATASDNNLYLTESGVDKIGRIPTLFGTITEISLTAGTHPLQIVRGPDGNLWFTENGTNMIGRLSPNSFSVTGNFPTLTPSSNPTGITVGADGALWFTETGLDKIGRITTGGVITEYASPVAGLGVQGIANGPDGSLWFTEPGQGLNPGRIGRLVY